MEIFNDDLDILEIIENGFPRRINKRTNFFESMDNWTFFKRFRLTKPTVHYLLELIEDQLEYDTDKNDSVTPINQLLTVLRLYATGAHLSVVADFIGMHESTASRIVEKVFKIIAALRTVYIKMPSTPVEIIKTQHDFFQIAGFPKVVGCLDCTHVRILSPGGEDAEVFRNRKGYFSINVQAVGDSFLKIRDIVNRWPGSVHDSTIFANSRISASFASNNFPNCLLLGDSGYPGKTFLLTPVLNVQTRGQRLYNESHIRTRNSVERVFGVWKRRFPILAYGLRFKLETSLAIITAAACLHNLAIERNEENPPVDELNEEELNYLIEAGRIPQTPAQENFANIQLTRNRLINYFEELH